MTTDNKTLAYAVEEALGWRDGMRDEQLDNLLVMAMDMLNAAPTLADVQPGGRVRLGDQAERARFEAWAYKECLTLHRRGDGEYSYDRTDSAWKSWKAAISAQPSPGGQEDALKALDDLAAFCSDDTATVDRHVAVIRAALAARQPVGEPVAWVHEEDPGRVISARQKATALRDQGASGSSVRPYSVPAYLHAPAQAVDYQAALLAEERSHSETIDQRDRCEEVADELADHIARITGVDIGEHSSANCPWQNAIDAAEEYKPAQAVDLGRARASIQSLLNWIDDWAETPEESGIDAIEAEAEAVLALIDKAVGNV